VGGELVSYKKQAIQAAHDLRASHGEAADTQAEDAKLQKDLDAVDAEEQRGRGVASDHASRIEGGRGAYLFTGSIPTDAGGGDDNPGWGILVLKDGCGWKRADGDFAGAGVYRAPDGALVLVQQFPVEQCSTQIRLSVVRSARDIRDLRITVSRHLEGVCPETERGELQDEGGTLSGVRVLSRPADDPQTDGSWTESGAVVFEKGEYVLRSTGR
jgi:hypothetical protein